jgi:D-beta-D-heptose 7-phosphate kinase/D-beta-D-heptose 1-phosphate adenosyltransferase
VSSRVVVLGDSLLDRDVTGSVERLCPDAPVPVVDVTSVAQRPGGAALAALLLAGTGAEVCLATGIGTDEAGLRLRGDLLGRVEVHDVLTPATTPGKTRVRSRGQSLLRLDDHGHLLGSGLSTVGGTGPAACGSGPADGPVDVAALTRLLGTADAVLVADYGGPVTRHPLVREVVGRVARTVPVVWDPHPRGLAPPAGVSVVTPNRPEATAFLTALDVPPEAADLDGSDLRPDTGAATAAARLRAAWQVPTVVVTDGAAGAAVVDGLGVEHVAPARVSPDGVDTCGAGDRFAGGVALGLAGGADVRAAVRAAVEDVAAWLAAGGVATAGRTQPPRVPGASGDPVDPAGTWSGDPSSVSRLLQRVRGEGGTVVATGGCFDVLHVGHLQLLEQAAAMGTCLVVLLNSDASVGRLKGPGRPVHPVADRARLLRALACVDAVVVFDEDTPTTALERLRPDVWVKGGDYAADELPETAAILASGGRVEVVPYLPGRSTTRILSHLPSTTGAPT